MRLFGKSALSIGVLLIAVLVIPTTKDSLGPNDKSLHGNTSGNLSNGGYFCEYNDSIYFSNIYDDGMLYRMNSDLSNPIKVSDDRVSYLNAAEGNLYYGRKNHEKTNPGHPILDYTSPGIYRLDLNTERISRVVHKHTGMIHLIGNYIYFQKNTALSAYPFYRVRIDGKSETQLSEDNILPASITNNYLYYASLENDFFIKAMNLDTLNETSFIPEPSYMPIINGDYLYYISIEDDYSIYRTKLSEYACEKMVTGPVFTYNITSDQKYLYYQIDGVTDKRICQLDTETKEEVILQTGNYHNIHITKHYIFFTDFNDTTIYYLPIGNPDGLSILQIP